ncbi:hypothetical protein HispidOSU_008712, partial [Sigmodon hispidus]
LACFKTLDPVRESHSTLSLQMEGTMTGAGYKGNVYQDGENTQHDDHRHKVPESRSTVKENCMICSLFGRKYEPAKAQE